MKVKGAPRAYSQKHKDKKNYRVQNPEATARRAARARQPFATEEKSASREIPLVTSAVNMPNVVVNIAYRSQRCTVSVPHGSTVSDAKIVAREVLHLPVSFKYVLAAAGAMLLDALPLAELDPFPECFAMIGCL